MSNYLVGLVMDVVVLGFLVATIFYVIRLSKSLNDFKTHRSEFDGVITSLLSSIDQAERSIRSLKQVSVQEATELERLIIKSKSMCEELEIINDAGESMAKRLEKLAERNRIVAQQHHPKLSHDIEKTTKPRSNYRSTLKDIDSSLKKNIIKHDDTEADLPSFMIQDRDYGDNQEISEDVPDDLQSQAEKELFSALHAGRHNEYKKGNS